MHDVPLLCWGRTKGEGFISALRSLCCIKTHSERIFSNERPSACELTIINTEIMFAMIINYTGFKSTPATCKLTQTQHLKCKRNCRLLSQSLHESNTKVKVSWRDKYQPLDRLSDWHSRCCRGFVPESQAKHWFSLAPGPCLTQNHPQQPLMVSRNSWRTCVKKP